ncbi:carotenoid oxygenase family protein [Nocardia goodfellowii]|uniref:Dioxygenase n=1 Tax=Nocardia goodfellowii TaxID=882446 RepID=A0ABS4QKZ1_9NOCA|nr:carotenoid cleavage dioxygenase-like enzyme [Nocardia goodfellowii]
MVTRTLAHNHADRTSYLMILDATDLTAQPLARIHLPVRVPTGFHGNWLPIH